MYIYSDFFSLIIQMRFRIFFIFGLIIFTFSSLVKGQDSTNQIDTTLIIQIFEDYKRQDKFLHDETCFLPSLLPFIYTIREYDTNGFKMPLGPQHNLMNEFELLDYIGQNEFFSLKKDSSCIKQQIVNSEKVRPTIKLPYTSAGCTFDENKYPSEYHVFYVPIFNTDSSAVFVQHDYYTGVYGQGNGAILIKKKNGWKMVQFISGWMM